jgi:hypothetical protein
LKTELMQLLSVGLASIQTTGRYLGSEQDIAVAVNDGLGF